jgi:transposase
MMYPGFDVGKRRHDAEALHEQGDVVRQLRFAATRAGHQQLATWLGDVDPTAVQIGLEATGIHWLTLHAWLRSSGAPAAAIRVLIRSGRAPSARPTCAV